MTKEAIKTKHLVVINKYIIKYITSLKVAPKRF